MSTDEGPNVPGGVADDHAEREDRDRSGERIGLAGGDDSVTLIQLAARWAESDSPDTDSLASRLRRFRAAYEYVVKGHGDLPGGGQGSWFWIEFRAAPWV